MLMTMDCPRCGFTQPKDQFCANCGLNVEQALKQKPPLVRRVLASPRLYVSLIALLAALVIVFIFNVKVPGLSRVKGGAYLSSREAADPGEPARPEPPPRPVAREPEPAPEDDVPAPAPAVAVTPAAVPAAPAPAAAPEFERFDAEFWELGHEQTAALVAGADRVAEDSGGRAVVVHDVAKLRELLRTGGRPMGPGYHEGLRANAQVVVETAPTAGEGFRFGLVMQLLKWDSGKANFRFTSSLASTPPETDAERAAGPSARPAVEGMLAGSFELGGGDALLVVLEPPNRRPRPEVLTRAGPGPWQIFTSASFAVGETDWVATVRLVPKDGATPKRAGASVNEAEFEYQIK